jgi:hypothetical protein
LTRPPVSGFARTCRWMQKTFAGGGGTRGRECAPRGRARRRASRISHPGRRPGELPVSRGSGVDPAAALIQYRLLEAPFFFRRAFFSEHVHASPQLFRGLLRRRARSYLGEVVARLFRCGPSMFAGALNIPDVPFPVRSGREEDQVFPLQQVDPILPVGPNDLTQGLRYVVISQSPLLSVQGS